MTKLDPRRFDSLLAFYLEGRRTQGRSREPEKNLRSVLTRFLVQLRESGVHDIRSVTEAHIVSYLRWLETQRTRRGTSLSYVTRESALSAVKVFLGFLEKRRVILLNPAADVRLKHEQRLPRGILSVTEARRLLAAPWPESATGRRDRAVLEVLYGSGLRASECSRLDLSDVDLMAGTAFVRNGKGKKDRVVPLTPHARTALDLYLREARPQLARDSKQTALFVSWRTAARLTRAGLQMLVRNHAKAAGIARPVHPHALRHTCATHLLQGGADVRHIQRILGHKFLTSTMLYTRVGIKDLRAVIERAHPRERERKRRKPRLPV